jgi:MFS transporter, DHA1 family, multidrug resistance protein
VNAAGPAPKRAALAPSSGLAAILIALVAVGPISTDMYLASLPSLVLLFHTDVASVQLTLSLFLAGFAVAQLAYGPISDRFGRRPALLGGLALYAIATLGCLSATGIEWLIVARFLQAVGACAGPVIGRAIVRDVYPRDKAAQVLAYIGMTMGLVPAFAPIIGSYLQVQFGWRASFVCLLLYSGTLIALVFARLPESNQYMNPEATRPGPLVSNYVRLLASPAYLGYVAAASGMYAGLFSFISGSSFVIIGFLNLPTEYYGYCFAAAVAGYMAGAFTAGRLTLRLGVDKLIVLGVSLGAFSGVLALVLALAGVANLAAILAPVVLFVAGMGIVLPNAQAGAIAPYPRMAGAASALFGFFQMGIAALVGAAVGHLDDGTQVPMVAGLAVAGLCSLAGFTGLVRPKLRSNPAVPEQR